MSALRSVDERWGAFCSWAFAQEAVGKLVLTHDFFTDRTRIGERGFPGPGVVGNQIPPSGRARPLYFVTCEVCGRVIVRTYDHVLGQKRYGRGSRCRKSDGMENPCGPDTRRTRLGEVTVPEYVKRFVDRTAKTGRARVALTVLLSKVERRETFALHDDLFWWQLARRVIEDAALGYDVTTVEHMVSHARASIGRAAALGVE